MDYRPYALEGLCFIVSVERGEKFTSASDHQRDTMTLLIKNMIRNIVLESPACFISNMHTEYFYL